VELADSVDFNYQIDKKGNPNPDVVDSAMTAAGKKLADFAVQSRAERDRSAAAPVQLLLGRC
jgi:hypothetical protein